MRISKLSTFVLSIGLVAAATAGAFARESPFNEVVSVGEQAPAFSDLPGTDGKPHGMSEYKDAQAVVIVFTSNQCPVALAYDDRLLALEKDYGKRGVQIVAICANFEDGHELENLKQHAADKKFNFPLLRSDDQDIARAYGASHTPHVFLLDGERKIAYMGAIDNNEEPERVSKSYLRDAIDAVLSGKKSETTETQPFGCRIRYKRRPADRTSE